jgi:hypothetical protein
MYHNRKNLMVESTPTPEYIYIFPSYGCDIHDTFHSRRTNVLVKPAIYPNGKRPKKQPQQQQQPQQQGGTGG